jgi:phosphatidylserine/phosphatidylglycerophosphate/cardiolipin synthase-like enzyme
MVEFLTTTGLTYSIEKIIKHAKSKIVIVSPYIKISRNYHERLIEAEKRNIKVTIIFGKEVLTADQDELLGDLNKLELYFCDNLHAKCYMNESSALISSMNLYEYSQVNNREMGILIEKSKEPNTYLEIETEIESIRKAADRLIKSNNPIFNQKSKIMALV